MCKLGQELRSLSKNGSDAVACPSADWRATRAPGRAPMAAASFSLATSSGATAPRCQALPASSSSRLSCVCKWHHNVWS